VIACGAIHPEYLEVITTYVQHAGIDLQHAEVDAKTGQTGDVGDLLDDKTARCWCSRQTSSVALKTLLRSPKKAHAVGALLSCR